MTEFEIRDDFELRGFSIKDNAFRNYTPKQISNAVSYFEIKIKDIPLQEGKTLGIAFGFLGPIQLFFMLALIRSARDYTIFYCGTDFLNQKMVEEKCYHMFLSGPWKTDIYHLEYPYEEYDEFIKSLRKSEMYTELFDATIEEEAISFDKVPYNSKHSFRYEQKVYINFGPNHEPQLAYNTGSIEDSCTRAAMEHYYSSTDVVALVRPFRHIGVGTLSIYPAVFKAKKLILCTWQKDWEQEASGDDITHIHVPYELLRDQWKIPKKLRMLTSGGYNFTKEYVNYLRSVSEIDNVVDCYGTSYCPPPLAIRRLNKDDTEFSEFTWVNDFIKPLSTLFLTCDDPKTFGSDVTQLAVMENGLVKTNDLISTGPFKFIGSHYNYVRVKDIRVADSNFENFLKNTSSIENFVLKFVYINGVKEPVLELEEHYKEEFEKLVSEHAIEIKVNYVTN